MGLSFLNKKTWHPGSFANIEKVWIAEQKQREAERKALENQKKLKEERQIEELKRMQVEAGLIPASHLQRLDWIYQAPESTANITTAEEFLLGKPLKDEKPEEKRHFTPVFQESYSNPQNEVFTKIHEDPMFVIKREEIKNRKEIEENPYRMKMILKDIENNILKKKKEKKKHKKKHKRSSSSSSSSSSSESSKSHEKKKRHKSKKEHKEHKSHREQKEPKEEINIPLKEEFKITTPSLLKAKLLDQSTSFGLVDKEGKKIPLDSKKNLAPDETLYREKKKSKEREHQSKKRSHHSSYKALSEAEKEQLRLDMEKKAQQLDLDKYKKVEEKRNNNIETSLTNLKIYSQSPSAGSNVSVLNKPGFLKSIEKDVYTSGNIKLEDRVRRNRGNIKKDNQ